MARDYKKEYRTYHGKPSQVAKRSTRNKARRAAGLKKGNPNEVDHRRPLSKGGTNAKKNLRVVSQRTNRKKGSK
jgi:5-methylcytosine-specific restriction endonuclease McrA